MQPIYNTKLFRHRVVSIPVREAFSLHQIRITDFRCYITQHTEGAPAACQVSSKKKTHFVCAALDIVRSDSIRPQYACGNPWKKHGKQNRTCLQQAPICLILHYPKKAHAKH